MLVAKMKTTPTHFATPYPTEIFCSSSRLSSLFLFFILFLSNEVVCLPCLIYSVLRSFFHAIKDRVSRQLLTVCWKRLVCSSIACLYTALTWKAIGTHFEVTVLHRCRASRATAPLRYKISRATRQTWRTVLEVTLASSPRRLSSLELVEKEGELSHGD